MTDFVRRIYEMHRMNANISIISFSSSSSAIQNDAQETASFLLQTLNQIPNVAEVSAQIINQEEEHKQTNVDDDDEERDEEENSTERAERQLSLLMDGIRSLPLSQEDRRSKSTSKFQMRTPTT